MSSLKVLFARALVIQTLAVSPVIAQVFQEDNGMLMIEAESSAPQGAWRREGSIGGYSGSGYLRWDGPDAFGVASAGNGTVTYRFRVSTAGNYQLRWRSRITRGNNPTEHNDSWVRFPSGRNVPGQQALSGWTKVFMSTLNQWVWQSATVDHVGRAVVQYFPAGEHTVQISGRSNGHAIDRIALYRYQEVSFSSARFDSTPQSRTSGQSGSPSTPVPPAPVKPQPAPAPVKPQPAPAPVKPQPAPAPAPAPATVPAPVVSVAGSVLSWPAVDAIAINVHRGNGQWLESLPATQTDWRAPGSGTYYLVATGTGTWETWGRSRTVTVNAESTSSPVPAALTLSAQAYSGTAVEIFWDSDSAVSQSFEVRRNGRLLTVSDGRSYFEESLKEGTRYTYSVTAINSAGDAISTASINVATLGQSGAIADVISSFNVTAKVYSQSAIELFWNTDSLDAGRVYRFEVYRDGERVQRTDGRSYFTNALTAGTSYEYSVTAIDSSGSTVLSNAISLQTSAADRP